MPFKVTTGIFYIPVTHDAELTGVFSISRTIFIADIHFTGIVFCRMAQPESMADFMGKCLAAIVLGIRITHSRLVIVKPGTAGYRMLTGIGRISLGIGV